MENSQKNISDDLTRFVQIKVNQQSHIFIRKSQLCLNECENKPCTYICPIRVYYWENERINILYNRCVECGACIWGCPYENISWNYPKGGYGVQYKY